MTTNTTQFTQGPWVVKSTDEDINTKTIIDSNEFWIAKVLNFNRASDDIRESQANANLIAAAPAMYEALVRLAEKVRRANSIQHGGGKLLAEDWAELYQITNESFGVIAQAEGR